MDWRTDDTPPDARPSASDAAHERAYAAARDRYARLREAARSYFELAPPYSIRFEEDGTVTLRRKHFLFRCGGDDPAASTSWPVLSRHASLDEAERRLRHVCGPKLYYDQRGRVAQPPPEDGRYLLEDG